MIGIKDYDKPLKGSPVEDLAGTDGIKGYLVRRHVLKQPLSDEKPFARRSIARIEEAQSADGSWAGSVIETCAQIDALMALGVSPQRRSIQKARKWIMAQRVEDDPVWMGTFVEPGRITKSLKAARGGHDLRAIYAKHCPHVAPEACCAATPVVATCCVLQTLFSLGEDVSTTPQLGEAVDRILTLGNAMTGPGRYEKGICGGQFSDLTEETAPGLERSALWRRTDNLVFRMSEEENPGVPVCGLHLLRAISRSADLSSSPLVSTALSQWEAHQLPNGNFDTKRWYYNFYFALDTVTAFRGHATARRMVSQMLPAILRRQKKDGKWWQKGEWIEPTYSAVWALHAFDLLELNT